MSTELPAQFSTYAEAEDAWRESQAENARLRAALEQAAKVLDQAAYVMEPELPQCAAAARQQAAEARAALRSGAFPHLSAVCVNCGQPFGNHSAPEQWCPKEGYTWNRDSTFTALQPAD